MLTIFGSYCAVLVVFLGSVQQQYTVMAHPSSGQG